MALVYPKTRPLRATLDRPSQLVLYLTLHP